MSSLAKRGYVVEELLTGNVHFLAITCLVLALSLIAKPAARRVFEDALLVVTILLVSRTTRGSTTRASDG
jgi:hypothetical protein